MVLHTLIVNLFKYIALLVGVAVEVCARVPTSWLKSLIAAILAILVIQLYAVSRHDLFGLDFQFFWKAGCDVWGGVDPYSPSRFTEHPFLNPPTALPLFALFAALPIRASLAFWTLLNVASSLGLIVLARSTLMSQDRLDVAGHQVRGGLESLPPCCDRGIGDLPELLRSLAEGPLPRPARRVHGRDAGPGAGRPGSGTADLGWGLPLPGNGQVRDDDPLPGPVSPPGRTAGRGRCSSSWSWGRAL